jgi:hypothetical protein
MGDRVEEHHRRDVDDESEIVHRPGILEIDEGEQASARQALEPIRAAGDGRMECHEIDDLFTYVAIGADRRPRPVCARTKLYRCEISPRVPLISLVW